MTPRTSPVVAIVPARGGSRRIPRKNVRPFRGVPLLARTLATAAASGLFDRIVVSTDDDEVARIAEDAGADVPFRRPDSLADDRTPTAPVVTHAILALEDESARIDRVCVIYPTAVFTTTEDLRATAEHLVPTVDYVVPCVPFSTPIERGFLRRADGTCDLRWPEHRSTRTQDLPTTFHDAGQFYWGRRDAWVDAIPVFAPTTHLHPLPAWRVQDIDTPDDWRRAELLHAMLDDLP